MNNNFISRKNVTFHNRSSSLTLNSIPSLPQLTKNQSYVQKNNNNQCYQIIQQGSNIYNKNNLNCYQNTKSALTIKTYNQFDALALKNKGKSVQDISFLKKPNDKQFEQKINKIQQKLRSIVSKIDTYNLKVQFLQKNVKNNISSLSQQIFKYLDQKCSTKVIDLKISDKIQILKDQISQIKLKVNHKKPLTLQSQEQKQFKDKVIKIYQSFLKQQSQKIKIQFNLENQKLKQKITHLQYQIKKLEENLFQPLQMLKKVSFKIAQSPKISEQVQNKISFAQPKQFIGSQSCPSLTQIYRNSLRNIQYQKQKQQFLSVIKQSTNKTQQSFLTQSSGRLSNLKIQYEYSSTKSHPNQISNSEELFGEIQKSRSRQIVYYLDQEGNLLDKQGFYLLDQNQNPIHLTQEQTQQLSKISMLSHSKVKQYALII